MFIYRKCISQLLILFLDQVSQWHCLKICFLRSFYLGSTDIRESYDLWNFLMMSWGWGPGNWTNHFFVLVMTFESVKIWNYCCKIVILLLMLIFLNNLTKKKNSAYLQFNTLDKYPSICIFLFAHLTYFCFFTSLF